MSDKVPLSERLKDPEFRKKVKHAGIRLDLEDQKWMMEEVERLRAALRELLSHPSDEYRDAQDTGDGYFLTPKQMAERRARAALEGGGK